MKKLTLSKAKARAWKQFSLYIRLSHRFYFPDSDKQTDEVECYTCGAVDNYKNMQTGHWIEGHANAVYINENYVRVQCKSCNLFRGGNQGVFRDKIRAELGDELVDKLIMESKQTKKMTVDDYKILEIQYSYKVKELLK